jgi:hypothetical protein
MNHLETFLSWSILSFEIVLCWFVVVRKAHRILPVFATYAYVCLACTVSVWSIYGYFGFESDTSYYAYWASTYVIIAARSLAIAELCRYGLRNYRGIWALVWRVLAILSVVMISHALVDAWGQPNGIAIYGATLTRDFAFASVIILALLFLIRNYYGLTLDPLQRLIGVGICLTCIVDVITNTILRNVFTGYLFPWFLKSQKALWPSLWPEIRRVQDTWGAVHLLAFMFSMGIWCFALRKPLAVAFESPQLLPAKVYREMSPAINLRLAAFNDRMTELLKP